MKQFAVVCPTTGGELLFNEDDVFDTRGVATAAHQELQATLLEAGMDTGGFTVVCCLKQLDGTYVTQSGQPLTAYTH
jgi:hypothetical protein